MISFLVVAVSCGGRGGGVPDSGDASLARLEYTPESNPVEVMVLQEGDFNRQLVSNGKLYARQKSALSFNSSGKIAEIHVGNGSYVNRGDIIASLDRQDAEASYRQAQLALDRAEVDYRVALIGVDTLELTDAVLNSAKIKSGYSSALIGMENARRTLDNIDLRAPFSGKIASIERRPYEAASGVFCTIVNDGVLDVEFSVLESELGFVKKGQRIKVATFTSPDKYTEGRITQINPMVDDRGLIKVTGEIGNDGTLIDGMNIKVLIEETVPGQLVVPKDAVVIRDNFEVLFRFRSGRALWTYVHTLMSSTDSYSVVADTEKQADLNVGDTIIVSGNLNLGDGAHVEIKE